jgi:hypothetical protein
MATFAEVDPLKSDCAPIELAPAIVDIIITGSVRYVFNFA